MSSYKSTAKSSYSTPPISPATATTESSSSSIKLSRSRQAQIYLEEHVPQWKDDVLIQSLFANLPNREVKPEAFKQKYSFWKDVLISMTRERLLSGSVFKFETKNLSCSFKRGGLQPICLNGIILEMINEGIAEDLMKSKRISIVGGMVSWIYGSLKTILIGEDDGNYQSDDSLSDFGSIIPETIILPSLFKEQFEILKDFLSSNHLMPFTFEEFHEIINESRRREGLVEIVEKEDVLLFLKYLSEKKIVNYLPTIEKMNSDSDLVTFAIKVNGKVTAVDFDIVKMKRLHNKLLEQVNELSDGIRELSEAARKSVLFDKKMALYHLKRKGLLEKVQGDRMNSLHAVDELLMRISSLSDDAMILEAYKSGAKTLKGLLPDVEEAAGVVQDLQEIIADHDNITATLNSYNSSNISNIELDEELEAELLALTPKSPLSKAEAEVDLEVEVDALASELNKLKTAGETDLQEDDQPRKMEFA